MQSINAGFQKLKRLLPVNDGEKISKANILQHAADYIQSVERDRLTLYEQNTLLRNVLIDLKNGKVELDAALNRVNFETMPSIPINPHVALHSPDQNDRVDGVRNSVHNSSNDNTDNNTSNDDCLEKGIITTETTSTISSKSNHQRQSRHHQHHHNKTPTAHRNGNKQNKNNNGNNNDTTSNNNKPNSCDFTGNNNDKNNIYHELTNQPISSIADVISDKVTSPKNGLLTTGVAKAAIALPLEVPYTTETVIRQHHHPDLHSDTLAARKLIKMDPSSMAMDSQDAASKGQNLDTICKAIMEIEGDRVFKNENDAT